MKIKNAVFSNDKIDIGIDLIMERNSEYQLRSSIPKNKSVYIMFIKYNGEDYLLSNVDGYATVSKLDVDFDIFSMKFPIRMSYNFTFGNTSIHSGFGISNKVIINSNNQFRIIDFQKVPQNLLNSYLVGPELKLGIERKVGTSHSISGSVVYEYLFKPSAVDPLRTLKENRFAFQLAYYF
jgi:hypothetical protein